MANGAHSSMSRPPIWPTPTMPRVLPSSSELRSAVRSCTRSRRMARSATTIFLARASMNPSACSATASRPGPELLHTITPAAVHASTSMMSYPAPAEQTASRSGHRARRSGPQIHCSATPGFRASSVRMSDW